MTSSKIRAASVAACSAVAAPGGDCSVMALRLAPAPNGSSRLGGSSDDTIRNRSLVFDVPARSPLAMTLETLA